MIINFRYFNPQNQNEYQSFGDGMNVDRITSNKDNDGRLKAYELENEVLDIPLISNESEPLDYFIQ